MAPFRLRLRRFFGYFTFCSGIIIAWIILENVLDMRIELRSILNRGKLPIDIVYENCTKIPPPPRNMTIWPEEAYIHDPKIVDIRELADRARSRVWIDGKPEVRVGDTVRINVVLIDGFGMRRTKGGDLIRVWMKEPALGASATANVTDNQDGSYSAILTAFWEGKPTVKVAIIYPREVIATQFRRRYICPPALMNCAIFKHPSDRKKVEETPCSYYPQIPAYPDMCNFTSVNYGSPWYCGKPRIPGLLCHDWSIISDRNLVESGSDDVLLSDIEKGLTSLIVADTLIYGTPYANRVDPDETAPTGAVSSGSTLFANTSNHVTMRQYKAAIIPTNIKLTVTADKPNISRVQANTKCNTGDTTLTWHGPRPTGYLYNRKWTNRHCSGHMGDNSNSKSCLENTRVFLVGDSTVRQLFVGLQKRMPCDWLTGAYNMNDKSSKHRPAICLNTKLNYSLEMEEHTLPFCTSDTPRTYLKTFEAHLDLIRDEKRTIIILHAFAHFLNYHSHVFYETLQNMKKGIVNLLARKSNVFVIVKGPHTFSFAKNAESVMWMPDRYADIYQQFIYDTFSDLRDRVMFLECQDITISTEQWHIHVEDYVLNALVDNVLNHACPN